MKKRLFYLLLMLPVLLWAQDSHVQMKNCGGLCFIPDSYSAETTPVLHILQEEGLCIYDNNIGLIKCIDLPGQEFTYRSSRTRTRAVEGVKRSSMHLEEEITSVYTGFAASKGVDFQALTHKEQQDIIIEYDERFGGYPEMRVEEDYTLFIHKEGGYGNFFNHYAYGTAYPKFGILLDKKGRVYRFNAAYEYEYSDWSDYTVVTQSITSEENVLALNLLNSGNSLFGRFYLTATLFNDDEALEYVRPVYTLVDVPLFESAVPGNSEEPVTSEGEYYNKGLAISGIEIVNDGGKVLSTISFGESYDRIGNFQFILGGMIEIGDGINVFELGNNRFISFDTVDEDNNIIYKHFYRIDISTSAVEAVNAPVCIKVRQHTSRSIEVNYNSERPAVAELFSVDGLKCASRVLPAGSGSFSMNVEGSGAYILTFSENGNAVSSMKIMIK